MANKDKEIESEKDPSARGSLPKKGFLDTLAKKVDEIKDKSIEHVVIGSQGTGFPKETFFGSVSNFVLHKANIPVTIVK